MQMLLLISSTELSILYKKVLECHVHFQNSFKLFSLDFTSKLSLRYFIVVGDCSSPCIGPI